MKSHHINGSACGYRLRLNRRKTRRASEFCGYDSSSAVPPCRECCRKFFSWKGLFAHMVKRHMVNNRRDGIKEVEDFDCRDGFDMVNDSQSSDNCKGLPNRKKRSLRRKRCDAMKTINSLSSSDHAPGVELEHELEEVAVCLMMLSRDSFNGSSSVVGVHDSSMVGSSDDNSAPVLHKDPVSPNARADFSISGNFKNRSKRNTVEFSHSGIEIMEMGSGKNFDVMNENQVKSCKTCRSSSKRKFPDDSRNGKSLSIVSLTLDGAESEVGEDPGKITASRFECNTCKKTFRSYQALGGHRASHTKSKAAFGSEDTSVGMTELPPPGKATTDKPKAETVDRLNKKKKREEEVSKGDEHKCTVCLKVFPSGQALGGHKRSHLPEAAKIIKARLPVVPKPVRDFLDLNLPAPLEEEEEEEEEGTSSSAVNFKPCLTAGRNHPIIGLVAN